MIGLHLSLFLINSFLLPSYSHQLWICDFWNIMVRFICIRVSLFEGHLPSFLHFLPWKHTLLSTLMEVAQLIVCLTTLTMMTNGIRSSLKLHRRATRVSLSVSSLCACTNLLQPSLTTHVSSSTPELILYCYKCECNECLRWLGVAGELVSHCVRLHWPLSVSVVVSCVCANNALRHWSQEEEVVVFFFQIISFLPLYYFLSLSRVCTSLFFIWRKLAMHVILVKLLVLCFCCKCCCLWRPMQRVLRKIFVCERPVVSCCALAWL